MPLLLYISPYSTNGGKPVRSNRRGGDGEVDAKRTEGSYLCGVIVVSSVLFSQPLVREKEAKL